MLSYEIELFVGSDGAKVGRLLLHLPAPVRIADVKPDCFNVYIERTDKDGKILSVPTSWKDPTPMRTCGYLTVLAAYPADETGEPVRAGSTIALELDVTEPNAGAIIGTLKGGFFPQLAFRVTQTRPMGELAGLVWDELDKTICPQTARWANGISTYKPLPLQYGYFTPDVAGTRPLIIWLHGAGEGGQDPRMAYMGNQVTALSEDPIQGYFGGAYVLAPQSPTMWMDDGTHNYTQDGGSMYAAALFALIEEFVAAHPIDRKRIYVGGCSNGGYMSMRLILDHPDYFAAAFPMCEAMQDAWISDAQLAAIRDVPVWMLHAMLDMVVDPEKTSVPTYKRLLAAGAKNAHLTYIDDRPPRAMVNHGCWVPGLQEQFNEDFDGSPVLVDGKPATRFQWLAAQHK